MPFVRCGVVPQSSLKNLCAKINIAINLHTIRTTCKKDGTQGLTETKKLYGSKSSKLFEIALYNEHYFIYERTNINLYPIENYEECKKHKNWHNIKYIDKNGNVRRENNRGKTSLWVIRNLIVNNLVHKICVEDMMKTQYFNEMNDTITDDLAYDEEECLRENKASKVNRTNMEVVFFDFETITRGMSNVYEIDKNHNKKYLFKHNDHELLAEYKNKPNHMVEDYRHKPYLMCAINNAGDKYHSIGEYCGDDFIDWLKLVYGRGRADKDGKVKDVVLIAHNLRYDFSFIWEAIWGLNVIPKGTRLMGGGGRIYLRKNRFIQVHFLDSLNMIASPLRAFGKLFNLKVKKEVMPYNIYTDDNVKQRYIPKHKLLNIIKDEFDEDDKEQFFTNMAHWDCYDPEHDTYDIIEYSRKYCEMDCMVLRAGYNKFREQILSIDKTLDPINYCSSPSLSQDYLVKQGCYDGVLQLCGKPRAFIQNCVVGGRVMCRDNKKWGTNKPVADYDAHGLYNTAMERMPGFLMGPPKVIQDNMKSVEWLTKNTDGYFVKVLVLNNPKIKIHDLFFTCEYDNPFSLIPTLYIKK